jgi:hypothetical protein
MTCFSSIFRWCIRQVTGQLGRRRRRVIAAASDLFPWLKAARAASEVERERAATIVADRQCEAQADPIIRNAQKERMLKAVEERLLARKYTKAQGVSGTNLTAMPHGHLRLPAQRARGARRGAGKDPDRHRHPAEDASAGPLSVVDRGEIRRRLHEREQAPEGILGLIMLGLHLLVSHVGLRAAQDAPAPVVREFEE